MIWFKMGTTNQGSLVHHHQCLAHCLVPGKCPVTMWWWMRKQSALGGREPGVEPMSRLQCLKKIPHSFCKSRWLEHLWALLINFSFFPLTTQPFFNKFCFLQLAGAEFCCLQPQKSDKSVFSQNVIHGMLTSLHQEAWRCRTIGLTLDVAPQTSS